MTLTYDCSLTLKVAQAGSIPARRINSNRPRGAEIEDIECVNDEPTTTGATQCWPGMTYSVSTK